MRGHGTAASGGYLASGAEQSAAESPDLTSLPPQQRHEPAPHPPGGRFLRWGRRYVRTLAALDFVSGLIAVALGSLLPRALSLPGHEQLLVVLIGALGWPVAVFLAHGYQLANIGVGSDELQAVLRAAVSVIAIGSVASVTFDIYGLSALVVWGTPLAALGSLAIRYSARKILHHRQRHGRNVRQLIAVGGALAVADLATVLEREVHAGMSLIGVCVADHEVSDAQRAGLRVLGNPRQLPELVRIHGADAVAVTGGEATGHSFLRQLSWGLQGVGVELLVHPGLVEVAGPRLHIRPHVGLPLLHVEQPDFTGWRRVLKRAFDVSVATVGLVVTAPLLVLIAIAVKLQDGGPVIFRQTRVGLDGSTFTMLKFRSMQVDAEERLSELQSLHPSNGALFKLRQDPRVTRVGRFLREYSLDELPQLVNVLSGSMSLVGPRPPLQSEVDAYEDHARRRLLVTPGLTGLWQVSGRSSLSWEETVRLDLRYVENWTLTLDLLIIWKTVFAVLGKRGAL